MRCCDITAGMLKTPVVFERRTRTPDGAGGYTEGWTTTRSTRALVKSMSGSERWASSRVEATSTHKLVTRYFADVKESDRVTIAGRVYNIRFINNVEFENRWLEITLELGVAI
jgi:SPP1 family predicted phage head-tail adaptor